MIVKSLFKVLVVLLVVLPESSAAPSDGCKVRAGIDVVAARPDVLPKGARIALITNHTGLTCSGERTVDVLSRLPHQKLVALMSPEHGLNGLSQELVGDTTDAATGLTVFSLFNEGYAPTEKMVKDADVIVFDIQDIGTRFYTYISTMALAMETAGRLNKKFIVLDRVNPINGVAVQGPLADADSRSFVNYFPIPLRHGMTVGELARFFKEVRGVSVDLQVVRVENWERREWFDEVYSKWVNTSPNIRNLNAATLYPALGLLEPTNVSLGRGTDKPFEQFGAPWIKGKDLLVDLQKRNIPGVEFSAVSFTPDSSLFSKQACEGIHIRIVDRDKLDVARLGFEISGALMRLYPNAFNSSTFNGLLANKGVYEACKAQLPYDTLRQSWESDLSRFLTERGRFLLYTH